MDRESRSAARAGSSRSRVSSSKWDLRRSNWAVAATGQLQGLQGDGVLGTDTYRAVTPTGCMGNSRRMSYRSGPQTDQRTTWIPPPNVPRTVHDSLLHPHKRPNPIFLPYPQTAVVHPGSHRLPPVTIPIPGNRVAPGRLHSLHERPYQPPPRIENPQVDRDGTHGGRDLIDDPRPGAGRIRRDLGKRGGPHSLGSLAAWLRRIPHV
jgi:hypothetical protein